MKIFKTVKNIIYEMKWRDGLAIILILIFDTWLDYKIHTELPTTELKQFFNFISFFLLLVFLFLVFANRWYKLTCGRSLFSDLINPDSHGNIIQLLIRAKKYPKIKDKNISRGEGLSILGEGIVIGKSGAGRIITSPSVAEEHTVVFGGSGSGKTSSVLIPTAKFFNGSKFLIDVSSDITNELKKTIDVLILSPDSADSIAFDVLAFIDKETDRGNKMIALKQLAEIVVPETIPTLTGDGEFYQRSAHQFFYSALIYFYDLGLDFCDLCYKIQKSNPLRLISEINLKGSPNAKLALNGMGEIRDYILGNVKQNLDSQISLFSTSRKVKRILHRNNSRQRTVSAEILEKEDLIFEVPQDEVAFYSPLMKLISGIVILHCTKRPLLSGRKILIALDEFPVLGFLNILEPLRTLRKHNTRIMILTQSLSDIEYIYGKVAAKIIMDNCGIKLVLNSSDYDTNRYLSNLIGRKEVRTLTRTYDSAGARYSYSTKLEPSVSPEEFGRLKDELVAILPDGYLKLKKAYYWKIS